MEETRIQCELSESLYDKFSTIAKDSDRSISGQLRYVVKRYLTDLTKENPSWENEVYSNLPSRSMILEHEEKESE